MRTFWIGLLTFTVMLLAQSEALAVQANDSGSEDVCAIRPDLCDGRVRSARAAQSRSKHKKKRRLVSHRRSNRMAPATRTRCRPSGQEFDVQTAHLPVCGSEASSAANEALNELNPYFGDPGWEKSVGRRNSRIDLDGYIRANGTATRRISYEAGARGGSQTAFERRQPAGKIDLPKVDGGVSSSGEDLTAAASASPSSAPPSEPTATTGSGR